MTKKYIYLFFLVLLISFSYAETYSSSSLNYLSKNHADTLYCPIGGSCIFQNLTVENLISKNITVTTINTTNINVTGYVSANTFYENNLPLSSIYLKTETDPLFALWLSITPPLYSELDPVWNSEKVNYATTLLINSSINNSLNSLGSYNCTSGTVLQNMTVNSSGIYGKCDSMSSRYVPFTGAGTTIDLNGQGIQNAGFFQADNYYSALGEWMMTYSGTTIQFGDDAGSSTVLTFKTSAGVAMNFNPTQMTISKTTTQIKNLAVTTNNLYDLGAPAVKFRDIYLSRNLSLGGNIWINGINTYNGSVTLGSITTQNFRSGLLLSTSTSFASDLITNVTYLSDANCSQQLCPIEFYFNELGRKQFMDQQIATMKWTGYKPEDVAAYYPSCVFNETEYYYETTPIVRVYNETYENNETKDLEQREVSYIDSETKRLPIGSYLTYNWDCVNKNIQATQLEIIHTNTILTHNIYTQSKTVNSSINYLNYFATDAKLKDKTTHYAYNSTMNGMNMEDRIVALEGAIYRLCQLHPKDCE